MSFSRTTDPMACSLDETMGGQKGRTADCHVLYRLWAHVHFWLDLRWSISQWVSACACRIIPMFSRLLAEKWGKPHSQLWWEVLNKQEVQFYSFIMDELCWVDGQEPLFCTWARTHIYELALFEAIHYICTHITCIDTNIYEYMRCHWILGNSWIPPDKVKCSQNTGFVFHIQTVKCSISHDTKT